MQLFHFHIAIFDCEKSVQFCSLISASMLICLPLPLDFTKYICSKQSTCDITYSLDVAPSNPLSHTFITSTHLQFLLSKSKLVANQFPTTISMFLHHCKHLQKFEVNSFTLYYLCCLHELFPVPVPDGLVLQFSHSPQRSNHVLHCRVKPSECIPGTHLFVKCPNVLSFQQNITVLIYIYQIK